jgi:hypothetical protein
MVGLTQWLFIDVTVKKAPGTVSEGSIVMIYDGRHYVHTRIVRVLKLKHRRVVKVVSLILRGIRGGVCIIRLSTEIVKLALVASGTSCQHCGRVIVAQSKVEDEGGQREESYQHFLIAVTQTWISQMKKASWPEEESWSEERHV